MGTSFRDVIEILDSSDDDDDDNDDDDDDDDYDGGGDEIGVCSGGGPSSALEALTGTDNDAEQPGAVTAVSLTSESRVAHLSMPRFTEPPCPPQRPSLAGSTEDDDADDSMPTAGRGRHFKGGRFVGARLWVRLVRGHVSITGTLPTSPQRPPLRLLLLL